MIWRSPPRPSEGWLRPIVAVLVAVVLPAFLGAAILYLNDTPVAGLPKDGSPRSFASHMAILAAALTASPLIAWLAVPLAVPIARIAVITGWAGIGSAIVLAVLLGLALVHFALHGDVTTEDQSILPHIVAALVLQGASVWAVLTFGRRKSDDTATNILARDKDNAAGSGQ